MKWRFINFCSGKLLAGKQRLLLAGAVAVSAAALSYTYFAVEYVVNATVVSVADSSPHIRIRLPAGTATPPAALLAELAAEKGIVRCDAGIAAERDWHVVVRRNPAGADAEGGMHHANSVRMRWTGYAFDSDGYRPPCLLENVYDSSSRRRLERDPRDEPVRIVADTRESERRENWVIVNRHFTSLFPPDSGIFAHPFEVVDPGAEAAGEPLVCRVAGVVANSPFDIGASGKKYVLFTRTDIVEAITRPEERAAVIDISLDDRMAARATAERIASRWESVDVETWMEANAAALPFIRGIRISVYSGMAAVAFLAILGVGVAIVMAVEDRKRQLATLFAMGMDATELRLIFLFAGAKLVLASSLLGLCLASALAFASLPHWRDMMENFFHPQRAELVFNAFSLAGICLLMTVTAMAVSWIASRAVTASDPVVSLR